MRKLSAQFWLCLLLLSFSAPLRAQSPDPSFAATNLYRTAQIDAAVQQPDGKLVVSGNFVRVNGSVAPNMVRLNTDGSLDQAFTNMVAAFSSASGLYMLPSGQILAFGTTSLNFNGQVYGGLVKLNPNGTVASGFSTGTGPAGGVIRGVALQPDGKIVVGGSFTSFNGAASPGLVRLNADGSVDQAFTTALGAGFTGEVLVMARQTDGNLLVGGRFTDFNGTGRRYLVRLLPTGALDASYNPVSNSTTGTFHLALDPATGQAVVVGLTSGQAPVRLNLDGSADASFQAPLSSFSCLTTGRNNNAQLLVDGNRNVLLARGCVTIGGGSYLTRYTASGAFDNAFNTQANLNGAANVLLPLSNGRLLMAGAFNRYGGAPNTNIVQVDALGNANAAFSPTLDASGLVNRVVRQPDGKLLVAGVFREINGQAASNLARLQPNGTLDPAFTRGSFDAPIDALALQPDGKILVGGGFTIAAGITSPMLARLEATGIFDPSFQHPGTTATIPPVRSLAVQPDGKVLLGTNSAISVGGRTASLHRYFSNGQLDVLYNQTVGAVTGAVSDLLVLPDGRQYVAGSFTSFSGTPAEGLVRLLPDGAADPTFIRPATSPTSALVNRVMLAPGGQLVASGLFGSYRGHATANLVRLNTNGLPDTGFSTALTGSVLPLFVQGDGKIILGSSGAHSVGGVSQGGLSRLSANGTLDNTFVGGPSLIISNAITAAVQPDGMLVVGGAFQQVAGQDRMGVARLVVPNLVTSAARATEIKTAVWPVPASGELHLGVSVADQPRQVLLLDALGRVVRQQAATAAAEQTLSVRALPVGVYLLRVEYAAGSVTRRVVVE